MNNQQKKAFNFIYSVADGYGRTLPSVENTPEFKGYTYSRFYKDLRENLQTAFDWNKISELVSLFPTETAAFGKTWYFNDIQNMVFSAYEQIWYDKHIEDFPSEFNIDIQIFDSYLLSPQCFESINNIISSITDIEDDTHRYNNIIKSSKIAYIRKITLPEWNTQDSISKKTQKEKWYDRINIIEQL
jgi:hypothetical protein